MWRALCVGGPLGEAVIPALPVDARQYPRASGDSLLRAVMTVAVWASPCCATPR